MKLTAYKIGGLPIATVVKSWGEAELVGNPPFKYEATVSSGYEDISSVENLDTYYQSVLDYKSFRNALLNEYLPLWSASPALTFEEKKILVFHHVFPDAITTTELDTYWTLAERESYRIRVMEDINSQDGIVVTKSSTPTSEKYFCVTVDDSGTINTVEVKSFESL